MCTLNPSNTIPVAQGCKRHRLLHTFKINWGKKAALKSLSFHSIQPSKRTAFMKITSGGSGGVTHNCADKQRNREVEPVPPFGLRGENHSAESCSYLLGVEKTAEIHFQEKHCKATNHIVRKDPGVEGALEERGGVFTASLINGPSPGESDGLQLCDRGLGPINACPRVAATAVGKRESSSEECEKERGIQCGSHWQGSFENIYIFFFYLPTNPSVPSVLCAKGSCFLTRGEGRDSRPAAKEGWWGGGRQWRGPHPPASLPASPSPLPSGSHILLGAGVPEHLQ